MTVHRTRAVPQGPMHSAVMWRAVCVCPWRSRLDYATKGAAVAVGRGHEVAESMVADAVTRQAGQP